MKKKTVKISKRVGLEMSLLFEHVSDYTGISMWSMINNNGREDNAAKRIFIAIAHSEINIKDIDIGFYLGIDHSAVSYHIKIHKKRYSENNDYRLRYRDILYDFKRCKRLL